MANSLNANETCLLGASAVGSVIITIGGGDVLMVGVSAAVAYMYKDEIIRCIDRAYRILKRIASNAGQQLWEKIRAILNDVRARLIAINDLRGRINGANNNAVNAAIMRFDDRNLENLQQLQDELRAALGNEAVQVINSLMTDIARYKMLPS